MVFLEMQKVNCRTKIISQEWEKSGEKKVIVNMSWIWLRVLGSSKRERKNIGMNYHVIKTWMLNRQVDKEGLKEMYCINFGTSLWHFQYLCKYFNSFNYFLYIDFSFLCIQDWIEVDPHGGLALYVLCKDINLSQETKGSSIG